MAAKPIKTVELRYPMTQFLKINDIISTVFLGPVAESPKSSPAPISVLKEKIKSPFGKAKAENTRRIQLMLEETLTKNVQLQRVRN